MPRYLPYLFGTFIAVLLVAGPLAYAYHEQGEIRNFHVVRTDVLYHSGQLSIGGLERIVHDYGIKTVISLRDAARLGDPPPDLKEEKYCAKQDIHFVRISPRSWWSPDGSVPAEVGVRQFRAVMRRGSSNRRSIALFFPVSPVGGKPSLLRRVLRTAI